jgi:putative SOS response-associated peptidase YedK
MCGRFSSSSKDVGTIADDLGAVYEAELAAAYKPRWNVAPTQPAVIARLEPSPPSKPHLRFAEFGLHPRHGGKLIINARSEEADKRGIFAGALAHRRCVVPIDGFYEWQGERGHRVPIWFHPAAGGLAYLAAIYYDEPPAPLSFVILTTAPSVEVAPVHDRMPVTLDRAGALAWLARGGRALCAPSAPGFLVGAAASPRVNDVANDDASLLEPPPAPGQMKLW